MNIEAEIPGIFERPPPAILGTCFCAKCGIVIEKMELCKLCHAVNYCSRQCADEDKQRHCLWGNCTTFSIIQNRVAQGEFGLPDPITYCMADQDPFYHNQTQAIRQIATHLNISNENTQNMITQLYRLVSCTICLEVPQNTEFTLCQMCHMAGHCSRHKEEFDTIHGAGVCYQNRIYGIYASSIFYGHISPLVVPPHSIVTSTTGMSLFSHGWNGLVAHVLNKNFSVRSLSESDQMTMGKILEMYYSDVCTLVYACKSMKLDIFSHAVLTLHMVDFTGNLRYEDRLKSFEMLLHLSPKLVRLQLIVLEPPGSVSSIQRTFHKILPICKNCEYRYKSMEVFYINQAIDQWIQLPKIVFGQPNVCIWYSVDQLQFDENCLLTIFDYLNKFSQQKFKNTPIILTFGGEELRSQMFGKILKQNKQDMIAWSEYNPFGCEVLFADERIMTGKYFFRNRYILCFRQ